MSKSKEEARTFKVGQKVNVRRKNGSYTELKITRFDDTGARGRWYYGVETGVKTAKGETVKEIGFQAKQVA